MEELDSVIYEQRMLVFLEVSPQTNRYRQLLFNAEEFKKITANIGRIIKEKDENGLEVVETNESVEEYILPDLQSINL